MRHCGHRVGRRRIKGEHVKNTATIQQQSSLVDNKNFGGIQGAAGQARGMNVAQGRGHLYDVGPYEALWQEPILRQHGLLSQHLALVRVE